MIDGVECYRRFLDGDDNGIVEIIRDYKDGLILYLCGITGNILTAEELMEDTFFKLVTKKPKYSGKSSFKTWLYAIGRNAAVDGMRKRSKIADTTPEQLEIIADEESNLEREYLREEQKIELHKAISKLNPEYRQVIHLVFFEGFTNEETAKIMRKSKRQIENLIYRAKSSLKAELGKGGFVYEVI